MEKFKKQLNEKVITEISDNYDKYTGRFYGTKQKVEGTIIAVLNNGCYLDTHLKISENKSIWVNFYAHILKPSLR